MSDMGLYAGLYEQIREYAELVDGVLIALKEGKSSPSDTPRKELGRLLANLAENGGDDLSARRIAMILRSKTDFDPKWSEVGSALLSDKVDEKTVDLLENLAQSLEEDQAATVARMRGGIT